MQTRLLSNTKVATLVFLCLLFAGTVTKSIAAPPTFSLSLSDEKIVAGEPVFLRYTVSNPSATVLQLLWTEQKSPWLQVRILNADNKEVAPATSVPLDQHEGSMPGWWSRERTATVATKALILRPGQIFKGKIPLTISAAEITKPGTYHLEVRIAYRMQETSEEAIGSLAGISDKVKRQIIPSGYSMVETDEPAPSGLSAVEKSRTLRLVVTAADPQSLAKKAEQLRQTALKASGQEQQEAIEKLASWPASSAMEVWKPFVQSVNHNPNMESYIKGANINSLVLSIINNRNPALLPFLSDLTWKTGNYDAHSILEKLYVNGNTATQKKILQMYADHNEEFPRNPSNY